MNSRGRQPAKFSNGPFVIRGPRVGPRQKVKNILMNAWIGVYNWGCIDFTGSKKAIEDQLWPAAYSPGGRLSLGDSDIHHFFLDIAG